MLPMSHIHDGMNMEAGLLRCGFELLGALGVRLSVTFDLLEPDVFGDLKALQDAEIPRKHIENQRLLDGKLCPSLSRRERRGQHSRRCGDKISAIHDL